MWWGEGSVGYPQLEKKGLWPSPLTISQDLLSKLPSHGTNDPPNFADPTHLWSISSFYPFWVRICCHHSYFVKKSVKNTKTHISRDIEVSTGQFFFQSTVRSRPFRWCAETYPKWCGQPQQKRKTEKPLFAPIFAKIARRVKKILRAQNMARGTSFEPRVRKKSLVKKYTYGRSKFKKSVLKTLY